MMVIGFLRSNKLLSVVALIYLLLAIVSPAQGLQSLNNSLYYLKEMLLVLPVIFLLTAVIEAWVPKEIIVKRLGDSSGMAGALYSLALGSVSVGPIYAAFPISKMLIAKGASVSNIVIILSSWAVIKLPMLANEVKFLGLRFMAARWFLTVLAILGIGQLVSRAVRKSDIPGTLPAPESKGVLSVNEPYCVGCGVCARLLPNLLEMKNNKAVVKGAVSEHAYLKELAVSCPTKAIVIPSGNDQQPNRPPTP